MRTGAAPVLVSLAVALAPTPLTAQQPGERPECRPDELDMGDYCAGRPPPANAHEESLQRLTPVRMRSMMPGHAGEAANTPQPGLPKNTLNAQAGSGFGVQLGVFSQRATAESVARKAAEQVAGPYRLAPLARGERILWASIHGPFSDRESAVAARRRLAAAGRHRDAFVKPLDELKLVELNHETTEE